MLHALLGGLLACATAQTTQCDPSKCSGGTPSCPISAGALSAKAAVVAGEHTENVYFRNAAPFSAEILRVDEQGQEISYGILPRGMRRALATQHSDVWVARAVRPGTASDRRLLLEHRVGAVPIDDCSCPQPVFTDCSKPPEMRDPEMIHDPVVFENRVGEPVDIFYYNGTCEELVSWDAIGGVQPFQRKPLLSTQGHSFRLRAAHSRRFLMAHTLNDLVLRACDDDDATATRHRRALDGLEGLRAQARFFERDTSALREQLAAEISRLTLALSVGSNVTAGAADPPMLGVSATLGVAPTGATWSMLAGVAK